MIDYTQEDFARNGSGPYDVIVDVVGNAPYARCRPVLRRGGRLLALLASLGELLGAPFAGRLAGHRVLAGPATEDPRHLPRLARLAEEGRFRPLIDREYPFADIVAAHRHVDSGRKRGSVVVLLPE